MSTPHCRLFAEVLDTEVAVRMQDRPHSRSLNLASLPISHIGNRRFVDPRSRAGEEGGGQEKKSAGPILHSSSLFLRDRRYLYRDRWGISRLSVDPDDGGPFFGGGSWPTEAAASIPLGAYLRALRAYKRNSLAPPLSPDATAILFLVPRSYESVWLTVISSKASTLCGVISEITANYRASAYSIYFTNHPGHFREKNFS